MIDFEERLRDGLHDLAGSITAPPELATEVQSRLDRRPPRFFTQRQALVAAVAAVALLAVGLSVSRGGGHATTSLASATPRSGEPGWAVLASPLLGARFQHAAVAMDGEVLVFGGYEGDGAAHGAEVYAPGTGRWRQVANPPGDMHNPVAAWTGTEVLVLDLDGRLFSYDPASDRWDERARSPLDTGANGVTDVAWTGSALLAIRSGDGERLASPLVSYDLATDAWHVEAELPDLHQTEEMFWTGTGLIVTVSHTDQRELPSTELWAYSSADGWTELPAPPLVDWGRRWSPYAAWTGSELVVGGGWSVDDEAAALLRAIIDEDRSLTDAEMERTEAMPARDVAAWDPASGTWRSLPKAPEPAEGLSFRYPTVWTGDEVVTWHLDGSGELSGELLLLDPATGAWRRTGPSPTGSLQEAPAVWTGREMILVSGEPTVGDDDPMGCCDPEPVAVGFTMTG